MEVDSLTALRAVRDAEDDDVEILLRIRRSEFLSYIEHERELAVNEAQAKPEPTWRERLWEAPAATRLYMADLKEALGMSEPWIRKRMKKAHDPLPHRRIPPNTIVCTAGDVRAWWERNEVH